MFNGCDASRTFSHLKDEPPEFMDPYYKYQMSTFDEEFRSSTLKCFKRGKKYVCSIDIELISICLQPTTIATDIAKNNHKSLAFMIRWRSNDIVFDKQSIVAFVDRFNGCCNFLSHVHASWMRYGDIQLQVLTFVLKQLFAFPRMMAKICDINSNQRQYFLFCEIWHKLLIWQKDCHQERRLQSKMSDWIGHTMDIAEFVLFEMNVLLHRTLLHWGWNNHTKIIDWIDTNNIFNDLFEYFYERMNATGGFHPNKANKTGLDVYNRNNYMIDNLLHFTHSFYTRYKFGHKVTNVAQLVQFQSDFTKMALKWNQKGLMMRLSMGNVGWEMPAQISDQGVTEVFPSITRAMLIKIALRWKRRNYECQNRHCSAHKSLKICNACKLVFYCSRHCQKRDWKESHRKMCRKFALC
eukprot:21239_1